jgi:hypothetical protein
VKKVSVWTSVSATGGSRAIPWPAMSPDMNPIEHLSKTKSERTYPEVSKHSGIRDCFGSGMAIVPSMQNQTLDS